MKKILWILTAFFLVIAFALTFSEKPRESLEIASTPPPFENFNSDLTLKKTTPFKTFTRRDALKVDKNYRLQPDLLIPEQASTLVR